MKILSRFFLAMVGLLASGCLSNKNIWYLQDTDAAVMTDKPSELIPYETDEYLLQYYDVVDINIKTTSSELNNILSINESQNQIRSMGGLTSGDVFFLNGYTIDEDGAVDLPLVGQVKIVGMDLREAKLAIEQRMEKFINKDNYFVKVRLGGIRYSAIGEFNNPGKFTILQNRLTIFEAIANAGDLTTFANRKEVLLMRQYPEGVKTFTINLLNKELLHSEFFFIRQNDMIYARPLNIKQVGTGITAAQSLQVVLSIITVVLLYLNVTK